MSADQKYADAVSGLSAEQRAVVQEFLGGVQRGERRPLRVLACAGAGKTATVVTGAAALVRLGLLVPEEITLVTFTRAATDEMRHRLAGVLPSGTVYGVQDAGGRKNRGGVQVTTWHSLAIRRVLAAQRSNAALRRPHGWSGALNLDASQRDRVKDAQGEYAPKGVAADVVKTVSFIDLDDLWERIASRGAIPGLPPNTPSVRERFGATPDAKEIATAIERARGYGARTAEEFNKAHGQLGEEVSYAWDLYNLIKRNLTAWDFGDALQAYADYVEAGGDRQRLVIVDEAQDNNPLQMALARNLTRNHAQGRPVYVGDVRQSIYAFRGADPLILARADKPVDQGGENAMTLELSTNYRSVRSVVDCGNRVVAGEPWAVGKPAVAARETEGRVEFVSASGPADRAKRIAEDVAAQIEQGSQPRDFAVLSRTRAAMGLLEVYFLIKGVPAKVQGASPFFKTKPIARVMAAIRLAEGVGSESSMKADFKRLLRDFVPGPKKGDAVDSVWAAVGSPRTVYDDLLSWYDEETSKRYGRALLWSRDPSEQTAREDGFEAMLSAIEAVQKNAGAPPEVVVWEVARVFHAAKLIVVPEFDDAKPEGEAAGAAAEDTDRELIAALRDVAQGLGDLRRLCEVSVRGLALTEAREEGGSAEEVAREQADAANKVVVSTIHGSKGLEYPTVYLFAGAKELPAGGPDRPGIDLPEELRILYVGVTRARDRLVILSDGSWTTFEPRLRPPKTPGAPEPTPTEPEPTTASEPVVEPVPDPKTSAQRAEVADLIELRAAIAALNPGLIPLFDQFQADVLRTLAVVRQEEEARRRAELAAEPEPTPPPATEPFRPRVDPPILAVKAAAFALSIDLGPFDDYRFIDGTSQIGAPVKHGNNVIVFLVPNVVDGKPVVPGDHGAQDWRMVVVGTPAGGSPQVLVDRPLIAGHYHAEDQDKAARTALEAAFGEPEEPSVVDRFTERLARGDGITTREFAEAMGVPVRAATLLLKRRDWLQGIQIHGKGPDGFVWQAVDSSGDRAMLRGWVADLLDGGAPPKAPASEVPEAPAPEVPPPVPEPSAPVRAPLALREVTMPGKCYVQVRQTTGRVHGGPISPVEKGKPVLLPDYTPIVCEKPGGVYAFGYVSETGPNGWQLVREWGDSHRAMAEIGAPMTEATVRWLARIPAALREHPQAAALWAMAGGQTIRKEKTRYFAGGNEVPGGAAHLLHDAVKLGLLREQNNVWVWTLA